MSESVVSGALGGADVKIAGVSQKTQMNQWRVVTDVPQSDSTTFNDEPGEQSEPGPSRTFFDMSGIMKEGAAASGPIMPPPQNVALVFQAGGAGTNTISFTGNCSRAEATRLVNSNGLIAASGKARGPVVIAWNRGS